MIGKREKSTNKILSNNVLKKEGLTTCFTTSHLPYYNSQPLNHIFSFQFYKPGNIYSNWAFSLQSGLCQYRIIDIKGIMKFIPKIGHINHDLSF